MKKIIGVLYIVALAIFVIACAHHEQHNLTNSTDSTQKACCAENEKCVGACQGKCKSKAECGQNCQCHNKKACCAENEKCEKDKKCCKNKPAMKRLCFALDLKDDPKLMAEYKDLHQNIWPQITENMKAVGIADMEIYNLGQRMFMVVEIPDTLNWEAAMAKLGNLPKQQEWEAYVWKFQQALPMAQEGEKWMAMEKIYDFKK